MKTVHISKDTLLLNVFDLANALLQYEGGNGYVVIVADNYKWMADQYDTYRKDGFGKDFIRNKFQEDVFFYKSENPESIVFTKEHEHLLIFESEWVLVVR